MRKYHYTMCPLFDRSSYVFLFCLFVGIFSLQISAQSLDGAIHDVTAPLEILRSFTRPKTNYSGILHMKYTVKYERDFKLDSMNEELCLSWEEAWPSTGDRMDTFLHFRKKKNFTDRSTKSTNVTETSKKQRSKRRIFSNDNRVPISLRRYGHRFPFVSVVKLSTGCTGTLVSPQHVLTAAHCIHNQSDYVTGYKTLKVCILPKSRFSRRFHCIKVNSTFLPMGWLIGNENIASRFDYALLKLEQKHTKPYFELDVFNIKRPWKIRPPILHFTAFEDDKPPNTLWYRYDVITSVRFISLVLQNNHCVAYVSCVCHYINSPHYKHLTNKTTMTPRQ